MNVTPQQAFNRSKTISPVLQDALFSVQTAEVVQTVTGKNNIPVEKVPLVAGAVGLVLLGFIHPQDLASEIQTAANLSPQAASTLSDDFNIRIFTALKNDLDKAYAPALKDHEQANAPKIIQDIGPTSISTGSLSVAAKPIQAAPPIPQAPKPPLPDKGWSKMSPSDPMIKLAPAQAAAPMPPKPPAPAMPQQKPAAPGPGPMQSSTGEFSRFSKPQAPMPPSSAPTAPAAAPAPKSPAGPAPMMLHEDPGVQSIKGSSDFRISMSYQEGNLIGGAKSQPAPSKAAVIDFAGKPADKVVHYSEFRPSMPVPPVSSAGRTVSEITPTPTPVQAAAPMPPKPTGFASVPVPTPPQAPKPPAGAMPPKPPAPPTPPSSPSETKVINKDYV